MHRIVAYLFFFLISIMLFLSPGIVDSQDGFQYLTVARNLYYHGKPDLPNPKEYNDQRDNLPLDAYKGVDGNYYGYTGLGYSLALLPTVFISDRINQAFHIQEPAHFPLQSDWVILTLASFTSVLFAAILGIVLFNYLILLNVSKKQSFALTLVALLATNLLAYSRATFAHIMFAAILLLTFYLLKKYSITLQRRFLILSGISYGLLSITYNQTFLLSFPPYILYYFTLMRNTISMKRLKNILLDCLHFALGMIPFLIIFIIFENIRARSGSNQASASFYGSYLAGIFKSFPFGVFYEGVWGQLFSPGRSIFLYSPVLLIPFIFWHKIKPYMKPETIVFFSMLLIYVAFYAAQYSRGSDQSITPLWYGESSWGPRYLSPIIPFGMLVVGYIYHELTSLNKRLVFIPLVIIGFYIGFLGTIIPDQVKFHNLEGHFVLNGTTYTSFAYVDLFPRYSPVIETPKNLVKMIKSLPLTRNHGAYNVKFFDGFDFPFDVGGERWRAIDTTGYISFDNNSSHPIKSISFGLVNQPLKESSSSALISFSLNSQPLPIKQTITVGKRAQVQLPMEAQSLKDKGNTLSINVDYGDPKIIAEGKQLLGLTSFFINDQKVNIESLDFPYISSLGKKLTGATYKTYGNADKNPWTAWEIHTQMYERTPDFWWVKPLYYWDYPKNLFLVLFILDLVGIGYFGYKVTRLVWNEQLK